MAEIKGIVLDKRYEICKGLEQRNCSYKKKKKKRMASEAIP
jgi:hypothetical protein